MTRQRSASPLLGLSLLLLLGLGAAPALAQCAMCKATLAGSAEGRALQAPLNRAILLLLAAPYAIFACLVLVAFRERIVRWAGRTLAAARLQRLTP